MATKFYRYADGKYLGGFDGAPAPDGAIRVTFPPSDARMLWDGDKWIDDPALENKLIEEDKEAAATIVEATTKAQVDALWQRVVKGDVVATADLEIKLDKIDSDFDKPQ